MKCPSCSAKAPPEATECPSCGVVFAKWKKRRERDEEIAREEKARAIAVLEAGVPPAPDIDPRWGRGISGGIVLVWMVAFGLYYRHHYAHHHGPKSTPTGEFAQMRDPKTGDIVTLPVRRIDLSNPKKR
jgi:hypothetical protein